MFPFFKLLDKIGTTVVPFSKLSDKIGRTVVPFSKLSDKICTTIVLISKFLFHKATPQSKLPHNDLASSCSPSQQKIAQRLHVFERIFYEVSCSRSVSWTRSAVFRGTPINLNSSRSASRIAGKSLKCFNNLLRVFGPTPGT